MPNISYDFHIHSCLSPCANDDMTPANIVGMAVVAGLDAIAVTDHNSCKHCRTAMAYGEQYGVLVVPGMELCTKEEVHVLCYFSDIDCAERFGERVNRDMFQVPNKPEFFGNQLIYDVRDELIGKEEHLLLTASNLAFDELADILEGYGGIMVPAHVDKQSNSLLYQMGFVPYDAKFCCFELRDLNHLHHLRKDHLYLNQCNVICNSDAHQLEAIHGPQNTIVVEEQTVESILKAMIRP